MLACMHSDAERMAHWIARSSPVRVGVRADELAGLRTRAGGSSKRGKVMVRAAGFERAPAANGSGLRAIVADRGDEQLHELQAS